MAAYRTASGLSPLPIPGVSSEPLYAKRNGQGISTANLHRIIKEAMQHAASLARDTDPAAAEELSQASAHWLRHTLATRLVNDGHPLQAVAKILGHEDVATTSLYLHTDMAQMASIMRGHRPPDSTE